MFITRGVGCSTCTMMCDAQHSMFLGHLKTCAPDLEVKSLSSHSTLGTSLVRVSDHSAVLSIRVTISPPDRLTLSTRPISSSATDDGSQAEILIAPRRR